MKTNQDKLVMQQVKGRIHHPTLKGYRVGYDGKGRIIPSTGAITYNQRIGDSCMGLAGDHIEPGISLQNPNENENYALQLLACVGNEAKVISGDAKGTHGKVSGTHGGIEHVFIDFDSSDLENLNTDDEIVIKAYGQGLILNDYPDITVMNLDPNLLNKLAIKEEPKRLSIGVTHIVPAELMGSGLGSAQMYSGDYDIMTQDPDMVKLYHLDTLRFGDLVAIKDHYAANGPHYLSGALTIGVIVHSDSFTSGHGPGVCVLFSAKAGCLNAFIDPESNLINYLY